MMDLVAWGQETLNWAFFLGIVNIVIIDLILAGDNAVVIAMAVRSLPRQQRRWGIILGAGAAVLLRVVLTFFVAQLLEILHQAGGRGAHCLDRGQALHWRARRSRTDKEAKTLWQAMWLIVIADITMSTDNVLAVAGASHGNLFLLLFGLALSIPFVVFTSNLLSMLMDRYPDYHLYRGGGLGQGGRRNDLHRPLHGALAPAAELVHYAMEAVFAVGVIVVGKLWIRFVFRKDREIGRLLGAATVRSKRHGNPDHFPGVWQRRPRDRPPGGRAAELPICG